MMSYDKLQLFASDPEIKKRGSYESTTKSVGELSSTFLTGFDDGDLARPSTSTYLSAAISRKRHIAQNNKNSTGSLPLIGKSPKSEASIYNRDEKYFGLPARDMFFERYQWLSRQRRIMHTSSKETSSHLLFDNEIEIDHPFSSRQSRRPPSPIVFYDDNTVLTWDTTNVDDDAFECEVKDLTAEDLLPEETPTSPRTMYIASCIRDKLNPRASLVVRKMVTSDFSLPHQGIGDKMAQLLAESLEGIPCVSNIDLCDNHLTDAGMVPIFRAIRAIQHILEINLSQNVVGDGTARALAEFLLQPNCPLHRLELEDCSLDDVGCVRIVNAIASSHVPVESLNVSRNRIGDAEILNNVSPDLSTGGGALANLLKQSDCRLSTLKLSWNVLRLRGATVFAASLAHNKSLTYLDLSYNALGHDGGEALGDAMLDNRSLRTLLLAHNGIDSTACFTICAGILENLALRHVCLDGNPIGERGAKALMLVPVVAGSRVRVTANNCNISLKDSKCFFDPGEPCGTYALHLDRPFERAIVFKMLEIVASHNAYVFRRFAYEEAPGTSSNKAKKKAKQPKPVDLQLIQVVGDFICLIRSVIA